MSPEKFKQKISEFENKYSKKFGVFKVQYSKFEKGFEELYNLSKDHKLFWRFSPFEVYKYTFDNRKDEFLEIYKESVLEFAEIELREVKSCYSRENKDHLYYPN